MFHHQSVSLGLSLLCAVAFAVACSGEPAETPELQQGFAPLCGDPTPDAGHPDPSEPDAAQEVPPMPQFDCEIRLSKLSYDSPGADNAEFLELRVEGTVASAGQRATLGDCGLDHITLLNGEDAACASYRQIPVATLPVPADGYFVLCGADSQAALGTTCDLTHWGTSRLSNGWLQNGPSDVIALVGETQTHYAYEGVPAQCGDSSWHDLPADTGEPIDGADDVIATCGGDFFRLSLAQAPLRGTTQCPLAAQPDAATITIAEPDDPSSPANTPNGTNPNPLNPSAASSDESGSLGRAELLDGSVIGPNDIALAPEAAAPPPLWHDYGTPSDASPINPAPPPPATPSCTVALGRVHHPNAAVLGFAVLAFAAGLRRRISSRSP
jgi:hypothetical protein